MKILILVTTITFCFILLSFYKIEKILITNDKWIYVVSVLRTHLENAEYSPIK